MYWLYDIDTYTECAGRGPWLYKKHRQNVIEHQ